MIHIDHNHSSTSPLKSSASAAALDSFTWDVGNDDPFGTTTAGASGLGGSDGLGDPGGDPTGQLTHTQEFRPEEFLHDDLGDVMHLPPEDVGDVGEGITGVDHLVTSSATMSLPAPSMTVSSTATMPTTNAAPTETTETPGPPPPSSSTEVGYLASPTMREGDRSSSLSPVPETNSPSGQGEGGSAGGEEKEAEAPVEEPRKEEEEEEEAAGAAGGVAKAAEASRQMTPLSPLTPTADELDGEGEGEGEEKKEGEKKAEEGVAAAKDVKSQQQQKQYLPQQQPQQKQQQGRQTTKSPPVNPGGSIPIAAASAFMVSQQHQLRPSPETAIPTPDLISPSATNTRDPKVVKVLDLNVELLK